jgi:hypothetical protein
MKTAIIAATAALLFAGACKKEEDKAPTPAPAPAPVPAPVEAKPQPIEVKAPEPAAPAAPRDFAKLGAFDLMDAIKAAGWTSGGSGGMGMGAWNTTSITAEKDGAKAKITYVNPTGQPDDPKASIKGIPPKEQAPKMEKEGAAVLLKGDALLAVQIEGKTKADNQALLDAIVAKLNLAP